MITGVGGLVWGLLWAPGHERSLGTRELRCPWCPVRASSFFLECGIIFAHVHDEQ
jgi:hypothetical protein